MGYPFGQKGWRLYDLERKVYFVSRDVIFFENKFPFSNIDKAPNVLDGYRHQFSTQGVSFIDDDTYGNETKSKEIGDAHIRKSTVGELIVPETIAWQHSPQGGSGIEAPTTAYPRSSVNDGQSPPQADRGTSDQPTTRPWPTDTSSHELVSSSTDIGQPTTENLGKGFRIRKPSSKLKGYITNTVHTQTPVTPIDSPPPKRSSGTQFNM